MKIVLFAVLVLLAHLVNSLPAKDDKAPKDKTKIAIKARLGPQFDKLVNDHFGLKHTGPIVLDRLLKATNGSVTSTNARALNKSIVNTNETILFTKTFAQNLTRELWDIIKQGIALPSNTLKNLSDRVEKHIYKIANKTNQDLSKVIDKKVVELAKSKKLTSGRSFFKSVKSWIDTVENLLFPTTKKPTKVNLTVKPKIDTATKPSTATKIHTSATDVPVVGGPWQPPKTTPKPKKTLKEVFEEFLDKAWKHITTDAIEAIIEYAKQIIIDYNRPHLKIE